MKIVGIMGSPRKQGNTAFLLNKVMEGAKAAGAETVVFQPNQMNIRGCQACELCKTKGRCVIIDDMQEIYRAIDEADVVVLASPVYMWGMSAQLKLVVDRLYAYFNADHTSAIQRPVKLGLVFTQQREDPQGFADYFQSVAGIMKLIGFQPVPEILVSSGLFAYGQAEKNPALVKSAVEYGRKLIANE